MMMLGGGGMRASIQVLEPNKHGKRRNNSSIISIRYRYGIDSLVFRGSILWNYLPNFINSKTSICSFKKSIKS